MNPVNTLSEKKSLTAKDYAAPIDVRWCPGCGDYAILNAMQKTFAELEIPQEKVVFVSGIGCSSRFPYYMNTYGFHTIHGRAPTFATGIKMANPDLSVWLVTGDGDGLSIGGNHLLHLLRRNVDVNVLLFNNRIYGLTKGQYSPTSEFGKVTKTTPLGSIDYPINPLCFALAAEASFVARTMDTNPKHMIEVFKAAASHRGVAFIEIFQNCVIFNDGTFEGISGREVRDDRLVMLEDGKSLIFGKEKKKGIRLNGLKPEIVTIGENGVSENDILIHHQQEKDPTYAYLLTQMIYPDFPTPMGIFRKVENRSTYEDLLQNQIKEAREKKGKSRLQDVLNGMGYWEITVEDKEEKFSHSILDDAIHRFIVADELDIMSEQKKEEKKLESNPLLAVLRNPIRKAFEATVKNEDIFLTENDSIAKGIAKLKKQNIDCLVIRDVKNEKVVGLLSERDVLFKVALKSIDRENTPIKTIMTSTVETIKDSNSIGMAINKLSLGGMRHLPIVTKEGKVGMISIKDFLAYIHDNVRQEKETAG